MGEIGEISGLDLQGSVEERESKTKTLVDFLREEMDGVERGSRWKNLKQRLRFKGIGCCGSTWSFRATSDMSVREENEDVGQIQAENDVDPGCVGQIPVVSSVMNLATALAAERNFRAVQEWEVVGDVGPTGTRTSVAGAGSVSGVPLKVTLMRLIEEVDGGDEEMEKERGGSDLVCCVCMGRRKDAALIPCGHTFCRVCSREMWLNRGSCPLCNRSIIEILDIY